MSKKQLKDETLFCERCGISFIWAIEEQSQASIGQGEHTHDKTEKPTFCPGCRYLLPAPARERGRVLWYNPRKRYGFIVRKDHPEIYMHGSGLAERARLQPGDLVEFSMGETKRGPCACEIRLLAKE